MNGKDAMKFLGYLKKPMSESELREFKKLFDKEVNRAVTEILNGEIRESCGEFCTCTNPSLYLNISQIAVCASCGKVYVQNFQERT